MIKEFRKQPSLDAVLIAAAQKVEHYEIAAYEATKRRPQEVWD
jgi:ferritin-like metal-binding protein YciE